MKSTAGIAELKTMPETASVLVMANPASFEKTSLAMVKEFSREPGIYITFNWTHEALVELFKAQKIPSEKLFFIDMISKTGQPEGLVKGNHLHLGSPKNLTELSIALDEILARYPEKKFLYLDSLSTMAVYNDPNAVIQFLHYFTNKSREKHIQSIILALNDEGSSKLLSVISQFVNKVIRK